MRRVTAALLAGALCACADAPPAPEQAAVELFRSAERPPDPARIDALFGLPLDDPRRGSLHEALERLREASSPRVTGVQLLTDPERAAVDLEVDLPGGGSASYSVQLQRSDEVWIVRWFGGPDVEWPPPRRRDDPGLTSSAPPTDAHGTVRAPAD